MIPLQRPLIVFDLETTGADPKTARIVEIGFLLLKPDGTEKSFQSFINPGVPIPPEATAIHGITDETVKDAPTWESNAARMAKGFTDVDLAGYRVKFDIEVFEQECKRVGIEWSHSGAVIDGHRLWQTLEPRTLSDASEHFLGEAHVGAHRADADVRQTWRIIKAQLVRLSSSFPGMDSVQALHELLWPPKPKPANAVDEAGKLIWVDGEACLTFGKHTGKLLRLVPKGYLQFMLGSDFAPDVKAIARAALLGVYPRQE